MDQILLLVAAALKLAAIDLMEGREIGSNSANRHAGLASALLKLALPRSRILPHRMVRKSGIAFCVFSSPMEKCMSAFVRRDGGKP
jgi:hypothetical protein